MRPRSNQLLESVKRTAPGFTLIEILVVLVILAILAMLAYPSYIETVRKARRAEGRAALMKLMQQQERFYTLHNRYITFSALSTDPDEVRFQWFSGPAPSSSSYEISGRACDGETIRDCVLLVATPGTTKVNPGHKDAMCAELMITSAGVKSARLPACW